MKRFFTHLAFWAVFAWVPSSARAAVLYSENFDVNNAANWTTNDPGVTDITVDYFYDYSAIGVPAAPGGASTRGLRMTANNANGVFGGFSVSPTGQNFSGSYRVEFNLWQNYVGPIGPGGSGTTQLSTFGVGTSGATGIYPGVWSESVGFAATMEAARRTIAPTVLRLKPAMQLVTLYTAPLGAV